MIPRRFATPQYRYILSMEIIDHTGSTYVSMFNDDAEALLGIKAGELNELLNSNKEASEEVFKRPLFKEYIFTLRVKVRKRGKNKKGAKIMSRWRHRQIMKVVCVVLCRECSLWMRIEKWRI